MMALPPIEDLDARISFHLSEVASLRRQRNAHTLINQLPPELLAHVFSFCHSMTGSASFYDTRMSFKRVLHLTHVCFLWRTTGIAAARLWAYLPCGKLAMTKAVFERAKGAPLHVGLNRGFHSEEFQEANLLALSDMARIRSLTIQGTASELDCLKKSLMHPAPGLQRLEIKFVTSYGYLQSEALSFEEDRSFLAGETPYLHHLHLEGCTKLINALQVDNLRYLYLNGDHLSARPVVLAEMVGRMTRLEQLNLTSVFATKSDLEFLNPAHQLLHLRRIFIQDKGAPMLSFIRSIRATDLKVLDLDCTSLSDIKAEDICRTDLVSSKLTQDTSSYQSVSIVDLGNGFQFYAGALVPILYHPTTEDTPTRSLRLKLSDRHGVEDRVAIPLLEMAAQAKPQDLDISSLTAPPDITKDTWIQLFSPLSSTLHSLNVSEASATGLIDALSVNVTPKGRGRKTFFLHKLKSLTFNGVDFMDIREGVQPRQSLGKVLKHCLKLRAKHKLNHLTIAFDTCCGFEDEELQEIEDKGWAESVEWDGQEGDEEEFDEDEDCDDDEEFCDCGRHHYTHESDDGYFF